MYVKDIKAATKYNLDLIAPSIYIYRNHKPTKLDIETTMRKILS